MASISTLMPSPSTDCTVVRAGRIPPKNSAYTRLKRLEVPDVGEVAGTLHHVVEIAAGGLQDPADVRHGEAGFFLNGAGYGLPHCPRSSGPCPLMYSHPSRMTPSEYAPVEAALSGCLTSCFVMCVPLQRHVFPMPFGTSMRLLLRLRSSERAGACRRKGARSIARDARQTSRNSGRRRPPRIAALA